MKDNLKTRQEIVESVKNNLEILTPRDLSDYSVMLSAYLCSMSEDIAKATKLFYIYWEKVIPTSNSVREAEVKAKATEYYKVKKELEQLFEATVELIHAIKKRLPMYENESKNLY